MNLKAKVTSDDQTPSDTDSNLPTPRAFGTKAAAQYLGLSQSWMRKARIGMTDSPGPRFKKVGRKILYPRISLDEFLDDS